MSEPNKFRCSKNYKITESSDSSKSFDDIDFIKIKKTLKLLKNDESYKNYISYKKNKQDFEKSTGWLVPIDCNQFLDYDRQSSSDKKSVKLKTKYNREISNCKIVKNNKDVYQKKYLNSIVKKTKQKIETKISKTLKKLKNKRVKKLSCYVKILIDIANSKNCKNYNFTLKNIIDYFTRDYKSPDQKMIIGAKYYLEYLLTNKQLSDSDLKLYKKWYSDDNSKFTKALVDTIDYLFPNCK